MNGSMRDRDTALTDEALRAAGFERRFVSEEPRLSESVELYESLGFEVALRPLSEADLSAEDCAACLRADPQRYRVIWTRRGDPRTPEGSP